MTGIVSKVLIYAYFLRRELGFLPRILTGYLVVIHTYVCNPTRARSGTHILGPVLRQIGSCHVGEKTSNMPSTDMYTQDRNRLGGSTHGNLIWRSGFIHLVQDILLRWVVFYPTSSICTCSGSMSRMTLSESSCQKL